MADARVSITKEDIKDGLKPIGIKPGNVIFELGAIVFQEE
jgi:hypothetical protein